jgi:hypothetical protein
MSGVTIERELVEDVARLRVIGDLTGSCEVDGLIETVTDYVRLPSCARIEVDLFLACKISSQAVSALSAMKEMAKIDKTAFNLVGAHGAVRTELRREGLLRHE